MEQDFGSHMIEQVGHCQKAWSRQMTPRHRINSVFTSQRCCCYFIHLSAKLLRLHKQHLHIRSIAVMGLDSCTMKHTLRDIKEILRQCPQKIRKL